jgi:peptidoglycan-associated lipoprotein
MNRNLVISMLLVSLLAACSSKPVKEEPKAAVEDKSPVATQATAPKAEPDAGATTTPVAQTSTVVNPLTDPNNILSKRNVYFDFDKDEVKAEYRPLVEAHAKYLVANPNAHVALQGNADERGSREYNLALGQRRAAAVKKVLNVYGANDKQIETVSYGEEKPKATGHDEAAYAENRRVDIVYAGE